MTDRKLSPSTLEMWKFFFFLSLKAKKNVRFVHFCLLTFPHYTFILAFIILSWSSIQSIPDIQIRQREMAGWAVLKIEKYITEMSVPKETVNKI